MDLMEFFSNENNYYDKSLFEQARKKHSENSKKFGVTA